MDLILWRHAEAEDLHGDISDAQRQLTARGKKQAMHMAKWLIPRLPQNIRILSSPTRRTIQTVESLDRKFEVSDLLFTSASLSDHITAAQWPDSEKPVLLVGHQPTLGQLAALLMSGHAHAWDIKKGSVWWLRSTAQGHESYATLRAVMTPALLEV